MATIDESNRAIREAVAARMAATPADDPKMQGYVPQPEAGCTGCDGSPFVAKARTMEAAARLAAEATPIKRSDLVGELPPEFLQAIKGFEIKEATPTAAAEFKVERIAASMSPEQLDAAWGAIRDRREEMMARVRGEAPPLETIEYVPRPRRLPLIGVAGRAGCGKNLVASMVPEAEIIQLADPLYAGLAAMLGVPEEMLRDRGTKESPIDWLGKSPRQLLQTLGTDWGRTLVASDVWLRIAQRRLDDLALDGCPVVVIADVRFDNEAEMIRSRGGEVWLVEREPETAAAPHVSEAGISPDLIDRVIDNRGTPDQTRRIVQEALAG